MSNQETLQKYKDWKSIKNERSSVCYGWIIYRFFRFIKKDIPKIDIDDIVKYQSYLKKNFADATQANAAQALRSFFDFTNGRDITNIKIKDITIPRVEEKVPTYVVQSEFLTLCDIAKFMAPQINLAIRLLWFTGIRVSELCGIEVGQIDIKDKCARIQTRKAYKPKQIFWDDETHEIIAGVIRTNPERKFLLQSPRGGKISTRQVERWVKDVVSKAGLTKHITPHAFRHGATKEWLNNGVDLPAIKDLLGHRSLLSIEKYTKRLDDDIKEQGREAVRRRVQQIKYNLLNL